MQFLSSLHEQITGLFGLRVRLSDYVEDVGQDGIVPAVPNAHRNEPPNTEGTKIHRRLE
jgi:hypothetical protein